jgi:hypothetical protein
MSGACGANSTSAAKLATIQAAAAERYVTGGAPYGFAGDAASTANGRFYGYLAWAGKF